MNVIQKNQSSTFDQATTLSAYQEDFHVPQYLDSRAWLTYLGAYHHITSNNSH